MDAKRKSEGDRGWFLPQPPLATRWSPVAPTTSTSILDGYLCDRIRLAPLA